MAAVAGALALAPAGARGQVLAKVPRATAIAAQGGWVVWNVPVRGGWSLDAWHAGHVTRLKIRPRAYPFDVDLGTDHHGRTVAVFSRCKRYIRDVGQQPFGNRVCRIFIYELASNQERAAGEARPPGASDMTPAIWKGRIAYAEYRTHYPQAVVGHIFIWSRFTHRRVQKPHGLLPQCGREPGCDQRTASGWVERMDLGDRLLAFTWYQSEAAVYDHPQIELRADDAAGHSVLVAAGSIGELCDSITDRPSGPNVQGSHVYYAFASFNCFNEHAWINRYDAGQRKNLRAPVRHILEYARDGTADYGLVTTRPHLGCPCTLERLSPGPLRPS